MSKHFDDAQGGGRASDRVRTHVEQQIRSGAWPVGGRVPTEAELAAELNVSGITVGRTLRRLAQEGVLVRRRGGGTQVVGLGQQRRALPVLDPVPTVDANAELHCFRRFRGDELLAAEFGLPAGHDLFQCIVVQGHESGLGLHLVDTILNPEVFPDFLRTEGAWTDLDQVISPEQCPRIDIAAEIVVPTDDTVHRLKLPAAQPCLAVHRRFWKDDVVAATQQVLTPASVGRLRLSPAETGVWTPAPGGAVRG